MAACRRDGFARIPGVFTRDEMNRLRAAAILACRGGDIEARDGFPTLLFWPDHTYMRATMSASRRLTDIVAAYFGHRDFVLETCQYYFHLPGDGDAFAWHTDERFRPGVGNLYLQTAIVVDEWTEDNAVEFIPGSHREPFTNEGDLRTFVRGDRRGVKLLAQPGDVLTWSNTVVHGSEHNRSDRPRQYYMNGFRARTLAEC